MIIQSFAFLFTLIFIKDKPEFAPSLTSTSSAKLNIMESFKEIFSKFRNILDLLFLSSFLGFGWTLVAVISIILGPLNFSDFQTVMTSCVFLICGMIGGLFSTLFLDW